VPDYARKGARMAEKPTADGDRDGSWQGAVLRYVSQSLYAKVIIALIVIYYVVAVVGAAVGRFNLEWHGVFPTVVSNPRLDRSSQTESETTSARHNPPPEASAASDKRLLSPRPLRLRRLQVIFSTEGSERRRTS
jgi:hypothetical protein